MNQLIHNISIVLIFFGVILLTYNLTKSYNKCTIIKQNEMNLDNKQMYDPDRPSQMYDKMFKQADLWLGYADFDVKNQNVSKLI